MYNLLGGFGRMNMGEWASKDSISWRTASSISWRLQQTRHGCACGSCPPRNRHRGRVERGPVDVRPGPHEPQRRAGLGESQLPVAPAERGPGAGGGLLAAAGRRPHATSLLHGSDVSKRTVSPCSPVHPRPERRGFLGGLDKLLAVMVEGIGTQMHFRKAARWLGQYVLLERDAGRLAGLPGGNRAARREPAVLWRGRAPLRRRARPSLRCAPCPSTCCRRGTGYGRISTSSTSA